MKFLSDILAKAGLTVDGVVTLNNTATGQTPNANDNSTKLATTAWVRTFVQPYSLPIASDSILGGIKVGSGLAIDASTGVLTATGGVTASNVRNIQKFTATAGQTVFTITSGYVPGLIDIFVNGVKLDNSGDFTATNGSTVTLTNAVLLNDIVEAYCYINTFAANNALRTSNSFIATAGQTTFTVDYNPGFIDVFYNGSKLVPAEYTATNGTSVVFNTACILNDLVEIISYTYSVNGFTGVSNARTLTINGTTYDLSENRTWSITNASLGAQPQLNGTGLVRMSGTTVSYDNATYATQSYVTTAVANLVNSAPSTLDTLNELATALGNDANFATTITTSIGTKLPLGGGTLTGTLNGTSIRLSSDIQATDYRFSGTGYISYDVNNSGTESLVIRKYGTSVLTFNSIGAATFSNSIYLINSNTRLSSDGNGEFGINYGTTTTATYTFSIYNNTTRTIGFTSAGSATFSNGITSSGLNLNAGGVININSLNGFQIGADSASGGFYIYDNTNSVYRFKISNAGATVISEGLTVGGAGTFYNTITATGGVRSLNTGVDGTFQDAFIGVYSSNNNEQNAIQTSVSSIAQWSGFRFQVSNGGGSTGRTTVVDFLRDRTLFYKDLTLSGSLTLSNPMYSSSGTPLTFTSNGNSDTYTQTTIYVNQNNTSGDTANGIFIERGRLSNSGSAEVRNFIIGARGGSIQWRLDSAGNGTYSGSVSASTSITAGTTVTAGTRLQAPSLTIGYWDGATNRFESSTRPMLFTSYGQDIGMGFDGGNNNIYLKYSNGCVGFGTSSPTNRIHASGNIYSTDTVFGRNLKPEPWAGPVAGTPTSATIPLGYSSINISSPCDNQWRNIMSNLNDSKVFMWVTLGDAASKDTAYYTWQMTSPAYGVSNFAQIYYMDGGWNTGSFEFTYGASGGTYALSVRCTSYYNSANTAYGTIYFLRLE